MNQNKLVKKAQKQKNNTEQLLLFPPEEIRGDYKNAYRQIRNYLAGQFIGATRDETLLTEVIKCLFCKINLKRKQVFFDSTDADLVASYYKKSFFELYEILPDLFGEQAVFNFQENLLLDSNCIAFIDQKLSRLSFDNWTRDPFGDAYEVFVGSVVRGQEGQFFTPQNAVDLLVSLVNPQPGEKFIDPACGAGGFLNAISRHLISQGTSPDRVASCVYGVDKDSYLVRLAAARSSMVTFSSANVYCADSLAWEPESQSHFPLQDKIGTFDGVITNPPFGSRIVSVLPEVQQSFDLGYKWKADKKTAGFTRTGVLQSNVPPQVLFIERCLSLVRPGGRIGMVVPESLISSKNYRYVISYLRERANLKAVLGMPESLFKISGKGGTHTKTCLILFEKKLENELTGGKLQIFMAEAKWCGHDSRGIPDLG
jgi:type I restriction enzyme M protein